MAFLRFLGSWCLVAGAIALGHDVTQAQLAHSALAFTALGAHWSYLSEPTLASARAAVESWSHPAVWSPGITTLLKLPACAAFALVALALFWLGRRRRRIDVYSN